MPSKRCVLPVPVGPYSIKGDICPSCLKTDSEPAKATRLQGPTTKSLKLASRRVVFTRCGLDALIDDIWFIINAGLSGFPFTSADLGGFAVRGEPGDPGYETLEERDAEMFDDENIARRLCQALLYIPLPRVHNNWETTPKFPWNCSKAIQPLYRKALENGAQPDLDFEKSIAG